MKDYEDVYRGKSNKNQSLILLKETKRVILNFIRLYFFHMNMMKKFGDRIVVGSIGGHKVSAATRHKH